MYDFNYHRASSVAEAVARLQAAEDGKFLAGGMTLIPTLKQRLAAPSDLVDLDGCADLRGLRQDGEAVIIGAMTTHAEVARAAPVQKTIPALAGLAGHIGDPQVRNRGTIGGSLANNDPSADYPAACLGLDATIVTDQRRIPAQAFFKGLFETALAPDEIIIAVHFPRPAAACYQKFPNPASRYAAAGVMVARTGQGVRVAVTGASQGGVFRATAFEQALEKRFTPEVIDSSVLSLEDMISDIHAGAEYRRHLVGVMTRRAIAACAACA